MVLFFVFQADSNSTSSTIGCSSSSVNCDNSNYSVSISQITGKRKCVLLIETRLRFFSIPHFVSSMAGIHGVGIVGTEKHVHRGTS